MLERVVKDLKNNINLDYLVKIKEEIERVIDEKKVIEDYFKVYPEIRLKLAEMFKESPADVVKIEENPNYEWYFDGDNKVETYNLPMIKLEVPNLQVVFKPKVIARYKFNADDAVYKRIVLHKEVRVFVNLICSFDFAYKSELAML